MNLSAQEDRRKKCFRCLLLALGFPLTLSDDVRRSSALRSASAFLIGWHSAGNMGDCCPIYRCLVDVDDLCLFTFIPTFLRDATAFENQY